MQSCICLCRVSIDVPHSEGHRKAVVSNLMFPYKKLGGFFFLFLLDKFIYLNENFFKNFQLSTSTKILRNLDKVVHFIFIFAWVFSEIQGSFGACNDFSLYTAGTKQMSMAQRKCSPHFFRLY